MGTWGTAVGTSRQALPRVGRIEIHDIPPPLTVRIANWASFWKDLGQQLAKNPAFGLPSRDTNRRA
jgi:hypothetical protein